jgi:hypothetical protein
MKIKKTKGIENKIKFPPLCLDGKKMEERESRSCFRLVWELEEKGRESFSSKIMLATT